MQKQQNTNEDARRVDMASALTFHASFDHGPDADLSLGDSRIYRVTVENGQETGELMPGLGQPALLIAEGQGRFGAAFKFTLENSHVALYKAAQNIAYSLSGFGGTTSFWLSVDPADFPQRYCDPFQLADKDDSDACLWIESSYKYTLEEFAHLASTAGFSVSHVWTDPQQWFSLQYLRVSEATGSNGLKR